MRKIDLCGYFGHELPTRRDAIHRYGTRFTHGNITPPRASPYYAFRPRLLPLVVCSFYSSSFFIWCRKSLKPTRLSRSIEVLNVAYDQRTVSKPNHGRSIKCGAAASYCIGWRTRGTWARATNNPSAWVSRRRGGVAHIRADHLDGQPVARKSYITSDVATVGWFCILILINAQYRKMLCLNLTSPR